MSFNELFIYLIFVVGFALTPGPNMMLYLTYTFQYGRKAGWATAAGIVSAFVVHITFVVLGLTALLLSMPQVLDVLRYCGIAYLIYLAIRNIKSVKWKPSEGIKEFTGPGKFYIKGFINNMLNPGSLLLYFSLIPQFIQPQRGHIWVQNLILGALQMLGSFITNCIIIYFAGYATHSFFKNEKYQQRLRYAMSLLIMGFALNMLFMNSRQG